MYNIKSMVFVLTVCDVLLGFFLGVAFGHYYPEHVAWLFR